MVAEAGGSEEDHTMQLAGLRWTDSTNGKTYAAFFARTKREPHSVLGFLCCALLAT